MADAAIPIKKQPKWKKANPSSELNKLKSKLKTTDANNKELRAQIQRQIQQLVDQQRQFKQEKETKEIRRILKKSKTDQIRHVISRLKKLEADPNTDPALTKNTEQNLAELKALSLEDLLQGWPSRSTLDSTDVKHAVLTRAHKLHIKQSAGAGEERSEDKSVDEPRNNNSKSKKGPTRAESYFMQSLGGDSAPQRSTESFFTGSLGNDSDSEPIEQVEITKKKNRPGQRTRRRMAEEMRLKGALGPAPTSHKRAFSEVEADADTKPVKRRRIEQEDHKGHNDHKGHKKHKGHTEQHDEHKPHTRAVPPTSAETLHPSWSAIKKAKESQRVVLGNAKEHVVFDSDEE